MVGDGWHATLAHDTHRHSSESYGSKYQHTDHYRYSSGYGERRSWLPDTTFAEAVGWAGVTVAGAFLIYCLMSGLYALAEFVEEHLRVTKVVLKYAIITTALLVALLWPVEGVPLRYVLPALFAQLSFYPLLKPFPFIAVTDLRLILAAVLTIASHVLLMQHHVEIWKRHHVDSRYSSALVLMGFFLVTVWLVPFGFLLSLAANENTLPGASSGMPKAFYQQASEAATSTAVVLGGGAMLQRRQTGSGQRLSSSGSAAGGGGAYPQPHPHPADHWQHPLSSGPAVGAHVGDAWGGRGECDDGGVKGDGRVGPPRTLAATLLASLRPKARSSAVPGSSGS